MRLSLFFYLFDFVIAENLVLSFSHITIASLFLLSNFDLSHQSFMLVISVFVFKVAPFFSSIISFLIKMKLKIVLVDLVFSIKSILNLTKT